MNKIILIIVTFLTFNINAQECGTPSSTTNQVFNIAQNNDVQFCVNIKFHIVRETNGTGGFDVSQIQNAINYINQFYNSHLINVSSIGFEYINNSNLNSFDDAEFSQLTAINNVSNAINFYIVNSAPYYGRAGAIISNNLVIRVDRVLSPTSPHELGHCFNLLHTFQGTASGTSGCAENINGTNCGSCGDNVCDTPADANSGTTGGYSPDLTNTMSYYVIRDHFTVQQGARMRNAIGGSSILQLTLSSQCSNITGSNVICAISNYQFILNNPQNISVIWSITTNLQIINYSNSEVIIKAINTSTSGSGTITANLNGMLVTKTIWIGKPNIKVTGEVIAQQPDIIRLTMQSNDVSSLSAQSITSTTWEKIEYNGTSTNCGSSSNMYRGTLPSFYYQLKVTATNVCGTTELIYDEETLPVEYNGFSAKSTSNIPIYIVYPNPSKNIVNIDLRNQKNQPEKETKVSGELFDLLGQSKSKIEIIDNKASFSVLGLNNGIYLLKIFINDVIENHSIIIE